ncbi:MAG: YbjN domain-containing protein [Candidatus Methanomethylophilaceae archaeon]|nr:YbjN domain-containing protein [Candidatus Methanomethylophilaceae archaeon]
MVSIISDTVASVLDALDIRYLREEGEFNFRVGEDDGDITYCVSVDEEGEMLTVVGYFPVCVPQENVDRVCRLLNDLNEQSVIGAFSVDPEDRRPSFHLSNYVCGGAVKERIVQMCLLQVMGHVSHSFQAIARAMYGGEQYTFTFANESPSPEQPD